MTATDELRRLLDERGVEWDCTDTHGSKRTMWGSVERGAGILGTDVKYSAIEFKKGIRLTISDCSPEQAVEATLGRGTCKDMSGGDPCAFVCSECAAVCNHPYDEAIRYCPNCGRKVRA